MIEFYMHACSLRRVLNRGAYRSIFNKFYRARAVCVGPTLFIDVYVLCLNGTAFRCSI